MLKKSYQSYTKANISKLIKSGYKKKFISLSSGVKKYLKFLNESLLVISNSKNYKNPRQRKNIKKPKIESQFTFISNH